MCNALENSRSEVSSPFCHRTAKIWTGAGSNPVSQTSNKVNAPNELLVKNIRRTDGR